MAHSSPAVLNYAIALLREAARALFTPARGRHCAARRRRSTRVRRYAPVPVPPQAGPTPPPRPTPRLAPPRERIPAEEVALVRGYYRAFESERDLASVQSDALRRLDQWTARPPSGDLLAAAPSPRHAERVAA